MLWFFRDNFTARWYRTHFKKKSKDTFFIKQNFEVSAHCNSRWASANENMISRIRNSFAAAVSQQKSGLLPKYVIVVLDDDLITFMNFAIEGLATLLGTWVEWLVSELKSIVNDRLDQVPPRCKKVVPFFYWVTAPTHSYFSKERNAVWVKFNLSLESVIRTHGRDSMRMVKFKEHWDTKDSLLVVNDRMTETGLSAYWRAIDTTFKFNSSCREAFVAKKGSLLNPVDLTDTNLPEQDPRSGENPGTTVTSYHKEWRGNLLHKQNDPIQSFFRRHRDHGEHRVDAREDLHFHKHRRDDRFLLPQLHNKYC